MLLVQRGFIEKTIFCLLYPKKGELKCSFIRFIANSLFINVDAPKINFPSETQTVLSWKGNPTRLECVAEGYPAAVYSWVRAGDNSKEREFGNASVLTITPISDSDFTNYTCIAKNIIGHDSAVFLLKPISKYSCS